MISLAGDDVEAEAKASAANVFAARARRGLKLMIGRQVAIQVLTFSGGIVLARTLTPTIFGVFGIATFLIETFALFGDFGLAPSLVQRRDEITHRDLQVAFTLQQALLTAVAAAVWIVAPHFLALYPDLRGAEVVWLVRVMAVTLFLQSWRSMSMLQLERHLDFGKVAVVEVVEQIIYTTLAVGLAVAGLGLWALVWATLARGVLGTVVAYASRPWPVRLAWDQAIARDLLRYGVPFQVGAIVNSLGGWVIPLMVGTWIGPAAVGLLMWAGSNGRKPLVLMAPIYRVAFPQFSRLQDHPSQLPGVVGAYLYPPLALSGLWLCLIVIASPSFVPLVYGSEWAQGINALYVFAAMLGMSVIVSLVGGLLRALGRVWNTTLVTVGSALATLAASYALIPSLGLLAVPVALGLAGFFQCGMLLWLAGPAVARVVLGSLARVAIATVVALALGLLATAAAARALGSGAGDVSTPTLIAASFGTLAAMLLFAVQAAWLAPKPHRTWLRRQWGRRRDASRVIALSF